MLIVEATEDTFGDIVADQQAILWDSGYFAQWQVGSLTSFEVSTTLVPLNPGKLYVIFVIGEVDIDALAEGESTCAIAWAILNVSVPFIRWELIPRVPVTEATQTAKKPREALRSMKPSS